MPGTVGMLAVAKNYSKAGTPAIAGTTTKIGTPAMAGMTVTEVIMWQIY
jgi:hypothetical protein